jgi:hypothetical protein
LSKWLLAAGLLALLAPAHARADLAWSKTTWTNTTPGFTASITATGNPSLNRTVYIGSFSTEIKELGVGDVTGPATGADQLFSGQTWCVDLFVSTNTNPPWQKAQFSESNPGTTSPSSLQDKYNYNRDLGAAAWILWRFSTRTLAQLIADLGIAVTSEAQRIAAVQLAVWKAAYGSGATVTSNNATVNSITTAMLNLRPTGATQSFEFVDYIPYVDDTGPATPTNQDMMYVSLTYSEPIVPEPATLASVLVGLLIPASIGLRRRLRASAAV